MNQETEQGVREAMEQFQSFCQSQIVAAWFADAPDPQALIDEMLEKWSAITRSRYERVARQRAETTGIISDGGQWLDDVLGEAQKRIRTSLARQIGEVATDSVACVRPGHNCEGDLAGCEFQVVSRSRKVN